MTLRNKLKFGWFCLRLCFKYGPFLVRLGNRIYKAVEARGEFVPTRFKEKELVQKGTSAVKRAMFDDLLYSNYRAWRQLRTEQQFNTPDGRRKPAKRIAQEFREDIWARNNPRKVFV